jgi:hypothetical protein
VTAPAEASPLAATLARAGRARANGHGIVVERRSLAGDGWVEAGALAAGGAELDELLSAGEPATAGLRHVAAAWLLERHAWLVCALAVFTVLDSDRVPDLAPGNLLIAFYEGVPYGIAARGERMTALAGDPACRAPEVTVARDERALRARAGAEVVGHLEPLVEQLAARRLRGRRALWRAVGDRLVQSTLWAGTALDRHDDAVALARELLEVDPRPRVPVRIAVGPAGPYQERASCCLAYRVDGQELCLGCPLARRKVRV